LPASRKRALLASGDDTHEQNASMRSKRQGIIPLAVVDRTDFISAPSLTGSQK
jgi:methionyl-tRNA synthetase